MKITISLLLCTLFAANGIAENLLPPALEPLREKGVQALFNMDYQMATTAFDEMILTEPRHPAGYVYKANTIWLAHLAELRRLQTNVYNRGNSFFSKTEDVVDPKIDKSFRDNVEKSITLSEARLKVHKDDVPTLYYMGIARNILGGYEATVKRSFMAALKNGSKGVGLHRQVLKKDPACIDAQLSIGMYNYIVGSLPLAVKILAFLGGVHGSKKDGIAQLENVSREGNYARDEANVLLIMLYKREKRIEDALKTLDVLVRRYDQNTLFKLERAVTLGQLKRIPESESEFQLLLQNSFANSYIPDLIQYQFGTMLSDAGRWSEAHQHFVAAYESEKATEALATLAHLNAGKCLDAQSRREDAKKEYQIVMNRSDAFESRDQARKYLKKPFAP